MHLSNNTKLFYILSLLVLLIPFIYFLPSHNPYEFPKFVVFLVGTELFALFYCFRTLIQKEKFPKLGLELLPVLVLLFTLTVFIANLLGLDPKISFLGSAYRHQGFITLLGSVLLFFLVRLTLPSAPLNKVSLPIQLSALLLCAIALHQAFNVYLFHSPAIPTYQGRIVGTLGNPNFLGGYLAMVFPFFLFNTKSSRFRLLLIVAVILTVILSQSRSAIIALLITSLVYFWERLHVHFNHRIIMVTIGILIAGTIFGAISFSSKRNLTLEEQAKYCLFVLPNNFIGDAGRFVYNHYPILLDRTSLCEDRMTMWIAGISAVSKKPIFGYGQENFELIFPKDRHIKVDNAHNIFLEVAISSGLAGLFLFVAIICIAMKKARLPIKLSFLSFLISGFFNPLSLAQIGLFWFLLGFSTDEQVRH